MLIFWEEKAEDDTFESTVWRKTSTDRCLSRSCYLDWTNRFFVIRAIVELVKIKINSDHHDKLIEFQWNLFEIVLFKHADSIDEKLRLSIDNRPIYLHRLWSSIEQKTAFSFFSSFHRFDSRKKILQSLVSISTKLNSIRDVKSIDFSMRWTFVLFSFFLLSLVGLFSWSMYQESS